MTLLHSFFHTLRSWQPECTFPLAVFTLGELELDFFCFFIFAALLVLFLFLVVSPLIECGLLFHRGSLCRLFRSVFPNIFSLFL